MEFLGFGVSGEVVLCRGCPALSDSMLCAAKMDMCRDSRREREGLYNRGY